MDKLLKLSFQSKEAWEEIKQTLYENETLKEGVVAIIPLGHMQKPPAADWIPDPNNPDDNGWTLYPDYAVDIVVKKDYNFSGLEDYIIKASRSGRYRHNIPRAELEIIVKE